MRFFVCLSFVLFWDLLSYAQKVRTPMLLNVNERWNDDFITDFKRGYGGWSIQGDYDGINTTNEYHGFYDDNSDILFRLFQFDKEGKCTISFNIIFGCLPTNNDSVIFEVTNDYSINNHSKSIYYTEDNDRFINDIRLYYGKNDLNTEPQCALALNKHGGYSIYYEYAYIISNDIKNIPFIISFIPNFINNSLTNRYYGVYNISILCKKDLILYKETHFLKMEQLSRYLVIWILGGIIAVLIFIFIIYIMCQRMCCAGRLREGSIHDQLIVSDPSIVTRKPGLSKGRGPRSIVISAVSAADIFRQTKTIKKKRSNPGISFGNSPIIDENKALDDVSDLKQQISEDPGYDTTIKTSANFSTVFHVPPRNPTVTSYQGGQSYNTIVKHATVSNDAGNDSVPLMSERYDEDSDPGARIDTDDENIDENVHTDEESTNKVTHLGDKKTKKPDTDAARQQSVKM